jgi:hypothetical protein
MCCRKWTESIGWHIDHPFSVYGNTETPAANFFIHDKQPALTAPYEKFPFPPRFDSNFDNDSTNFPKAAQFTFDKWTPPLINSKSSAIL